MKNLITSFVLSVGFATTITASAQDVPAPLDFGPKEVLSIASAETSHEFSVEIADTREEQTRGMMFRDSMEDNEGMLFEFDGVSTRSIWMKNTAVSLDILFVRKDGRILKIEHSAKPYSLRSMTSEAPVSAVLEIKGGQALERGIKPGDRVVHEYFDTGEK